MEYYPLEYTIYYIYIDLALSMEHISYYNTIYAHVYIIIYHLTSSRRRAATPQPRCLALASDVLRNNGAVSLHRLPGPGRDSMLV